MISKKNDEKCFCAKAELFDEYVKKTGATSLNDIVEESGMSPNDFIFALRNSLIDFVTEKENSDEIGETIRDSFYAFLREDFNYLNSEEDLPTGDDIEDAFYIVTENQTVNKIDMITI